MGDSCESNEHLQHLARRPSRYARSYKGYFVNGYKFHTVTHAAGRVTHNSGVYVRGTNYDDSELEGDYYGLLEDVLEVDFFGHNVAVVLFKCTWFDTPGGVRVDRKHGLVDIKHKSRLRSDDPFVLASQAEQVYYTPYPSVAKELKDWWAVVKTKPRGIYAVAESAKGVDDDDEDDDDEQFFQINERVTSTTSTEPNEDLNSVSLATGEATFVATHSEQEDVSENDASDDEEEFEDTDDDDDDDDDDNEDAFILSDD